MLDPMIRLRRTIQFDDVGKFFDAVRDRRSELEQPVVKFAVDRSNRSFAPTDVSRLTGDLIVFEVVAETATANESLELRMPCGEFRANIGVPPPLSAESNAVVEKLYDKCEELKLELLPMG